MEKLKSSLSRSIQLLKATAESTLTAVESLEAQMSLLVSEEVKGEKEKRKKKERDPNAPKRPGSGFFIFRSENLQKEVNGKKMTSGEVNAKWAALTEDEKASYNRKATKKLEQWKTESASYKASHTAEGGELHEEDDESDESDSASMAKPTPAPPPKKSVSSTVAAPSTKRPPPVDDDDSSSDSDSSSDDDSAPPPLPKPKPVIAKPPVQSQPPAVKISTEKPQKKEKKEKKAKKEQGDYF